MKLAIIISTYDRKDKCSVRILKNMFEMLKKQQYKKFKIFIIGDDFRRKNVFNKLCSQWNGEIYYENLPTSYRKGYFKKRKNLWTCGGQNAKYYGIKKAMEEGYEYYIHLDDDDYWNPKHVWEIVNTIERFPEVDFIASKAKYTNFILPREHKKIKVKKYNNWKPRPCNIVHSTWCTNLKTLGKETLDIFEKRVKTVEKVKNKKIKEPLFDPLDMILLNRYQQLQKDGKIKCILIPRITCRKRTDTNIPKV